MNIEILGKKNKHLSPRVQLDGRAWAMLIFLSEAFCSQVDMMDDEELLELVELETREMFAAQNTIPMPQMDDA